MLFFDKIAAIFSVKMRFFSVKLNLVYKKYLTPKINMPSQTTYNSNYSFESAV